MSLPFFFSRADNAQSLVQSEHGVGPGAHPTLLLSTARGAAAPSSPFPHKGFWEVAGSLHPGSVRVRELEVQREDGGMGSRVPPWGQKLRDSGKDQTSQHTHTHTHRTGSGTRNIRPAQKAGGPHPARTGQLNRIGAIIKTPHSQWPR